MSRNSASASRPGFGVLLPTLQRNQGSLLKALRSEAFSSKEGTKSRAKREAGLVL